MNRFLSNATNRIDAKGRVSVPSAFRSVLSQRDIQELYCFQDFIFPAISVGGPDLLDRFERQIAGEDPFSPEAERDVAPHSRGRGLHEARCGRALDGHGFHPGLHGHHRRSDLCRSGGSFSALGSRRHFEATQAAGPGRAAGQRGPALRSKTENRNGGGSWRRFY